MPAWTQPATLCDEGEQDLSHWLTQCPATETQRRHLFGPDSGRLDCLTRHPWESMALARSTLLGPQEIVPLPNSNNNLTIQWIPGHSEIPRERVRGLGRQTGD